MGEPNKSPSGITSRKVILTSLGFLILGAVGYFSLGRNQWLFYASAHIGALGVMGLLGSAAGTLAGMKGRQYWPAFIFASLFPIVFGILGVVVFLLLTGGHLYCGGSLSLLAAFLVIAFYSITTKRTSSHSEQAGH